MSELRINNIIDRAGSSGPIIAGVSTVTSTSHMVMPSGPTEMRGGRGRGIVAGGDNPTFLSSMEFVEIATTGNSTDFGDMSDAKRNLTGASSSIRGIIFGGQTSPSPNAPIMSIEYTTISSGGGGNDFGDLATSHVDGAGVTSEIRGFVCGGGNTYQNVIDFVTIASTGDSTDFADLAEPGRQLNAGCESPTRGIIMGGYNGAGTDITPSSATSTIQFFTFSSQGNTTKFGELTEKARNVIAVSDQTRGVRMGGLSETANPSAFTDTIDFITMASEGNATDFGNLLAAVLNGAPAQNRTRGIMMGGSTPTDTNVIQFITIQSAGNSTDFGDLLAVRASVPAGMCDINASNSG